MPIAPFSKWETDKTIIGNEITSAEATLAAVTKVTGADGNEYIPDSYNGPTQEYIDELKAHLATL
tara:strand:- start:9 stop:203 length:195 start_codon:yes stop_codon:yes gene_type:complete